MERNIDQFNEIVGLIFHQLYSAFPMRRGIYVEEIADAIGLKYRRPERSPMALNDPSDPIYDPIYDPLPNGEDFLLFIKHCRWWLSHEGFILGDEPDGSGAVQLSSKALLAMNITPDSLNQPLGDKLGAAVKQAGGEARQALISETVGQILGAATKGMLGV